ncbi:MAG: ComF family protein [Leptospiraceae bacterium]|nr:ComF family protein [Leptospiraceae bacterium]MCP5499064.1 ComF family protein [Leptospiraceae bacterium]
MKTVFYDLLNWLFPLQCFRCQKKDFLAKKIGLCKSCYSQKSRPAKETPPSFCPVCHSPLEDSCRYCNSRNIFFEKLFFLSYRNQLEKEIIQRIKFSNIGNLRYFFRTGLKKHIRELKNLELQAIIPVPSNLKTIKERPYRSCEVLEKDLSKFLQIPILRPVQKTSKELQSGKTYRERFLHAYSAFSIANSFQGKLLGSYLIIDDVFTTGATINEIARLLLQNGAEKIYVLVLSRGQDQK